MKYSAVITATPGAAACGAGFTAARASSGAWRHRPSPPSAPKCGTGRFAFRAPCFLLPCGKRVPGYKLHKIAKLNGFAQPDGMYARMASHWFEPEKVVSGAGHQAPLHMIDSQWFGLLHLRAKATQSGNTLTYLPNDILVKVDRATMAYSLEGRIPFLDHRVVEFAWRLPLHMKVRPNHGKWILRQVLYKYVLLQLIERPKMGFGIPLGDWLRGPLRHWAEALLNANELRQQGFFDALAIRKIWQEHLAGRGTWQYHLWDILMFQLWLAASEWEAQPWNQE